jgi:hypothetical protein
MPDEVARIGALSNGSNGQRSLESASLHFERYCGRERGAGRAGESGSRHAALACWGENPQGEILSVAKTPI